MLIPLLILPLLVLVIIATSLFYIPLVCSLIIFAYLPMFRRLISAAASANDPQQISRVIVMLKEFSLSHNSNVKKGGLSGLAAVAAGLGTQVKIMTGTRKYLSILF